MFKQLLMAGGLALFMTGCASVPMADSSKDAELKGFEAPSDVAGVLKHLVLLLQWMLTLTISH